MRLLKDHVPCQCTSLRCGATFQHGGLVSGNVTMTNCGTTCPYCGSQAKILDGQMTSGTYKTKELFKFIRNISDEEKLVRLSRVLKAANDNVTPEELSEELTSVDQEFGDFAELFKKIPFEKKERLIATLCTIIMVVLTYLNYAKEDPINKLVEIEDARFKREEIQIKEDKERTREFEAKIKALEEKFELLLSEKEKIENKKPVKGGQRNKKCPCGSGKKTKCCHPYWPNGLESA